MKIDVSSKSEMIIIIILILKLKYNKNESGNIPFLYEIAFQFCEVVTLD